MPTQHSPVTSQPCAASIISSSSQENGEGVYNTTKSGAEHSGNLIKSLPAFWHQPLILPTDMAENFTPSMGSATQPRESQSSDLQPEFLVIRRKISSSGCPLLLAWVQLLFPLRWYSPDVTGLPPQRWFTASEMLFLISSYEPSCQGEKQSQALPSFLLRETSWEMGPYATIRRICLEDAGSVTKPLRVSRNTLIFF